MQLMAEGRRTDPAPNQTGWGHNIMTKKYLSIILYSKFVLAGVSAFSPNHSNIDTICVVALHFNVRLAKCLSDNSDNTRVLSIHKKNNKKIEAAVRCQQMKRECIVLKSLSQPEALNFELRKNCLCHHRWKLFGESLVRLNTKRIHPKN